jgi:poly-gamma-glutamate synthesis protein (capsule biosynthesis protein)
VESLEKNGIGVVGRANHTDCPVVRAPIETLFVDLVAWTQWMNHPFVGDAMEICRQSHVLSWLEAPRTDRADLTIALPHWGYEFIHAPRALDRELATKLAACGVDIVAGNHAHVLQPAESVGEAVCFYGLGGLVQGRGAALRWPARLGSVLMIDVATDRSQTPPRIQWGYKVIPLVHAHGRKEHRIGLLRNARSREGDRMRQRFETLYPSAQDAP